MQGTLKKVILVAIVAVSMVIGFLFYQRFQPEAFIMPEEEIVGRTEILAGTKETYSGKTAGDGIPHIESNQELESLGGNDYAVITSGEILATGIYGRKPWVNPYSLSSVGSAGRRRMSTGKKAPEAVKGIPVRAEAYQEYYLIRLPDAGYCLAQLGEAYAARLKKGEEVILPMGKKRDTPVEARNYLKDYGESHGVNTSYMLYMVDDEWGEKSHFSLFLIRMGAAAGVFFVLAVGMILVVEKVSGVENL